MSIDLFLIYTGLVLWCIVLGWMGIGVGYVLVKITKLMRKG